MFRIGTPVCLECGHHTSVVLAACTCSCHATGRPPSGRSHPTRPSPPARGRVGLFLDRTAVVCVVATFGTLLTGPVDAASFLWFAAAVLCFASAEAFGN